MRATGRRTLIALGLVLAPSAAVTQPAAKSPRVGIVGVVDGPPWEALRQELKPPSATASPMRDRTDAAAYGSDAWSPLTAPIRDEIGALWARCGQHDEWAGSVPSSTARLPNWPCRTLTPPRRAWSPDERRGC